MCLRRILLLILLFSVYGCLMAGASASLTDSVPKLERSYPRRAPFSIYGGFGLWIPKGDLLVVEPVFNEMAVEAGLSFQAGLTIPIPFTKFFCLQGTLFSETSSSVKNEKDKDQFYFSSNDYELWSQYDPNDVYGIQSFMQSSFWFSEGTSWSGYRSQTQLLGLGIYLPISRYWRNFIFCTYQTGRMELTFGETRKYLSTDFFFNNGEDVFVISSPPITELTTAKLLECGLFFTAGKRVNITFHASKLIASPVSYSIPVELIGYGDLLESYSRNTSIRYHATNLHFTMGFRL